MKKLPLHRCGLLPGFIMLAASILPLHAATVAFREGTDIATLGITNYAGTEDTFIQSGANTARNYGASASLYLGKTTAGGNPVESKALLRFDITSLAGKFDSINSVTLTMTFVTQTPVNTTNIGLNLYQISGANSGWVEGTANGVAEAGSSSWNRMVYSGTNWAGSDGLSTSGTDYVATVIDGTKSISSPGSSGTQYSWTLPSSLIVDWIGGTNTGLLFASSNWGDMISGDYFRFASSGYSTASYRPTLTINYTIPEPKTYILFSLGLLIALIIKGRKLCSRS